MKRMLCQNCKNNIDKDDGFMKGGLCMLIVFGGEKNVADATDDNCHDKFQYIDKDAVAVVVRLADDSYNLATTLAGIVSDSRDRAEILFFLCFSQWS
jgi:hypothetical protein